MAVRKKFNTLGRGLDDLGQGLGALISTDNVQTGGSSTMNEIPLSQIERNPNQPRREFDEAAQNHDDGHDKIDSGEGRFPREIGNKKTIYHAVDGGEDHHNDGRRHKAQQAIGGKMVG